MTMRLGEQDSYAHHLTLRQGALPLFDDDTEIIERKGLGHPDTICDALACLFSIAYARYTREHCDGFILHHQFDKVMLIGGKSEVSFGEEGRFLEPVRLIIAGRASTSYQGQEIPVAALLEDEAKRFLQRHFWWPDFGRDVVVEHRWTSAAGPGTIKESTGPIAEMFAPSDATKIRGYGSHFVANDTSYCVGYAPASTLEQAVIALERALNGSEIKQRYPWLGADIKIMAVRLQEQIHLTACVPQIARFVPDLAQYQENLRIIGELIMESLDGFFARDQIALHLNTKDNYQEQNVYLTATGGSMCGDIGVVGRGNRPNGVITSRRPMSLEGASGKNPRYYAGIVYNLTAQTMAKRIHTALGTPCLVEIVSQNGAPLLTPWHTIVTTEAPTPREALAAIVEQELQAIPARTEAYLQGQELPY